MSFQIDTENLKQEMAEMPGRMADICQRIAEARNDEARAEQQYKIARFIAERNIRDLYKNSFGFEKKPTEDAIKMEVALNPDVLRAQTTHRMAEEDLRLLEAELQAYKTKADMLVSLSAYVRSEMETLRFSNAR